MIKIDKKENDFFAKKLTSQASSELQNKMKKIGAKCKDFTCDNSFNGISATHHIMYKLPPLKCPDGKREYEFLIEMDINDSDLGIYYGCKGLFPEMDNTQEAIDVFDKEWNLIKDEVTFILNNVFPDKDFAPRFRVTDNANDKTYWPFWVALYPDEDIVDVAARAVRIIKSIYEKYIIKDAIDNIPKRSIHRKDIVTRTAFTQAAYDDFEKFLRKKNGETAVENFKKFIALPNIFERNDEYECCWTVRISNVEFAFLWKGFYDRCVYPYSEENNKGVSWKEVITIFVNKDGEPFNDNLKKQYSQNKDDNWHSNNAEMLLDKFFPRKK